MFSAGILPGLVAIVLYIAAVQYTVLRDESAGPRGLRLPWRERISALRGIWGVLLLLGIVMGGIYGGIFTATEAATIGVVGALCFAVARGELSFKRLRTILVESAVTSTMLFVILIGAQIFSTFLNFTQLPVELQSFVRSFEAEPITVIIAICALYIVLGTAIEELSMILLTIPLFLPLVVSLGYDPIWFGILVVCVVEIGMISPPFGMNLFVINGMLPNVPTKTVWKGVMPFVFADIVRIAILILFPAISLYLPNLLFGN
jgi:tripartite ATP-independent transporter DctM subunit